MEEQKVIKCEEEPSEEEVRRHRAMGHPHFRSWCPHCVRGRGKATPRRVEAGEENKSVTMHIDYMTMKEREEGQEDSEKGVEGT